MTIIIGLTGRKGRGKSTLATMLVEQIDGAEIVALADALRDEVNTALNMIDAEAEDHPSGTIYLLKDGGEVVTRPWLEERKATVFGPILQGWGEFRRQWNGPDYWVYCLDDYVSVSRRPAVIIPDVRYVNEAEWIKSQGGLLVAIEGPCRWEGDARDDTHPSETGVDACAKLADIHIYNGADLYWLEELATQIAAQAKERAV